LGLPSPTTVDPLFKRGMRETVNLLQDPIDSLGNPIGWKLGDQPEKTLDILLIIGSDSSDRLDEVESSLPEFLAEAGFYDVYKDRGRGLFDSQEHFGFRDDISQPAVRGRLSPRADHVLARRYLAPEDPRHEAYARPGQPLIWPGQFVFGYPTQIEGQPNVPGPIATPPAEWMLNGSYLVFRRLRQDVAKFRNFSAKWASTISQQTGELMTQERLEGLMVGRWKDGTPLMQNPDGPDCSIARDPQRVNFFSYKTAEPDAVVLEDGMQRTVQGTPGDLLGTRCPHFAHVRKVNNRGATDLGELSRFLILRRAIPYGPDFVGPEHDSVDRGLLFLAYMRSIRDQFLVLSQTWMNSATAPEENGHDLLVGQNRNGRVATLNLPSGEVQITTDSSEQWVLPTGGAYLFVPSISVLKNLSSQSAEELDT
jgi:Dyp-type peroxidase family